MHLHRDDSGLWLPGPPPVRVPSRNPLMDFTRVTIGYELAFGAPSTIEGIVDRISRYSLEVVVGVASRITLVLAKLDAPGQSPKAQARLGLAIFGLKRMQQVAAALKADRSGVDWNTSGVLFHERQTINLLKLAFLRLPVAPKPDSDESLEPLGEALLMMNDLLDRGVAAGTGDEAARRRFELYVLANMLFFAGKQELSELARAYELFLRPGAGAVAGLDLAERLERATGVPAHDAWPALHALHGFFFAKSLQDVDAGNTALNMQAFEPLGFSEAESRTLVGIAAATADEMKAAVTAEYAGDPRYFHVLPFATRPLVSFEDRVHCVSLPLLLDLAGMGIQHRFLDPRTFDPAEREEFLRARGPIFQEYALKLLDRVFGERLVGPGDLEEGSGGGQSCDAVVMYPDAVLLFECKAALVRLDVRAGESIEQYEKRVLGELQKGVSQLDATIRRIEVGGYRGMGLEPEAIRSYIPVVATLELMQTPLTFIHLEELVENAGLLTHPKMAGLQLVDVSELELIEKAAAAGVNILDLLRGKLASHDTRIMSLKNYCFGRREPWLDGHNPYLASRFEEVSDRVLAFARSRRK